MTEYEEFWEDPPGRTGWETDHLTDPADDAETLAELIDATAAALNVTIDVVDWRTLAEEYRRQADYWREQYDGLFDEVFDLRERVYGPAKRDR